MSEEKFPMPKTADEATRLFWHAGIAISLGTLSSLAIVLQFLRCRHKWASAPF